MNCVICGKEIVQKNKRHVCCSQYCNAKRWRQENKERVKSSQDKQNEKRKQERKSGIKRYNPSVRKAWYENKKNDASWVDKINAQGTDRYYKVQEFLRNYKLEKGCADCGYNEHFAALEFDHVLGEKEFNVCNAKSIAQAKKEIEKCEVVCSNCHRIRTYTRLQEK